MAKLSRNEYARVREALISALDDCTLTVAEARDVVVDAVPAKAITGSQVRNILERLVEDGKAVKGTTKVLLNRPQWNHSAKLPATVNVYRGT